MHKTTSRLRPYTSTYIHDAIRIWNAAAHPNYHINKRFLCYNLIPNAGEEIEGQVAIRHGEAVGLVLACAITEAPTNRLGWISAIAVEPSVQRQGIGSALVTWAEDWLKEKGCERIRIGGNLRPFLPGLPYVMRENDVFFEKHGYQSPSGQPFEYDLARSLKDYKSIYPKPVNADLSPMQPGEEHLLLKFLGHEFPGRWEFEAKEFIKNGGRASDYLLLRVNNVVHGTCQLTLADSDRPIERFYPQRLSLPWGQFGSLGLSKAVRGQGLGGYLIDAAALHMQSLGVDGCVIDWTSLVELYGKFGFRVYNQYVSLFRVIAEE